MQTKDYISLLIADEDFSSPRTGCGLSKTKETDIQEMDVNSAMVRNPFCLSVCLFVG